MPRQAGRSARLEARIAPEALALVKRAAELEGRSLSDFIVGAAKEAARRTIEDSAIIRLAAEDQAHFVAMLLDPPEPAPALRRARDAHERLVRRSS
jgi:Uncharacterized protein conserved in bacteria